MPQPILLYLFGYPGTGKKSVAEAIEDCGDFIAIHSHLLSNALRHAVSKQMLDAQTQDALQHHTMKAWLNFLEFAAAAAPRQNLVLTSVLYENDPDRVQFFNFMRQWAAQQGRRFYPVRLTCAPGELARRVQSPARAAAFKLTDPDILQQILRANRLLQPPDAIDLDITALTPQQAANEILCRIGESA